MRVQLTVLVMLVVAMAWLCPWLQPEVKTIEDAQRQERRALMVVLPLVAVIQLLTMAAEIGWTRPEAEARTSAPEPPKRQQSQTTRPTMLGERIREPESRFPHGDAQSQLHLPSGAVALLPIGSTERQASQASHRATNREV